MRMCVSAVRVRAEGARTIVRAGLRGARRGRGRVGRVCVLCPRLATLCVCVLVCVCAAKGAGDERAWVCLRGVCVLRGTGRRSTSLEHLGSAARLVAASWLGCSARGWCLALACEEAHGRRRRWRRLALPVSPAHGVQVRGEGRVCVRVWRWVDAVPSSSSAPTPPPSSDRREAACGCVCVCVRGCVWHVGVESGGGVGWCRCGEGGSRRLDGEPSLACRFFVRCRRRRAVGGGEGGVRTGKWPQRASPGGVGRRGARERKSAKGRGGGEESERGFGVRCVWGESERASGVRALLL